MDDFSPSDLKTILHSKRANLYYLEHCRVLVNGGRVEFVTDEGKRSLYWNIPIANTTSVMLGTGTSITQAAMRELAKAGVLVGFCGGGGTPLFSANEVDIEVAWFTPQSEYRPTEYLQAWVSFWFDDEKRLEAAKRIQLARLGLLEKLWLNNRQLKDSGFVIAPEKLHELTERSRENIGASDDVNHLLTEEARLTKQLFKLAVQALSYGDFTRSSGARVLIPLTGFSIMVIIWLMALAQPLPGYWDSRMAWPYCMAKPVGVGLCSMWQTWSRMRLSCRRRLFRPCAETKNRNFGATVSRH